MLTYLVKMYLKDFKTRYIHVDKTEQIENRLTLQMCKQLIWILVWSPKGQPCVLIE